MWKAPAPMAELAPPEVEMLADEVSGAERTLRFRLRSPRRAEHLNLYFNQETEIASARLNGEPVQVAKRYWGGLWRWQYYALPPEGVTIELTAKSTEPIPLKVVEVAYRWPSLAGEVPSRPPHMMPMPYDYSDSTVVTRTFMLDGGFGVGANSSVRPSGR